MVNDVCNVNIKPLLCVIQVLVVWDVSISKARNYRLFEEVQLKNNPSVCLSIMFFVLYVDK